MGKIELALSLTPFLLAAPALAGEASGARTFMGAPLSVRLYGKGDLGPLLEKVFRRVEELDRRLSPFREDSDLSRINLSAPEAVDISADALSCLGLAVEASRRTGGAFNPLVGSLLKARGRLPAFGTPLAEAPALLDLEGLELPAGKARLRLRGMWLDPGGIGKGFALREVEAFLKGKVEGASLDFGGQLHFVGRRPGTGVWPAAIADPRTNRLLWSGALPSGSLSTSSQTEKPGHIIDPRGGRPPKGRVSVSVYAPDPAWADALSTAFLVMERDEISAVLGGVKACAYIIDLSSHGWVGDCRIISAPLLTAQPPGARILLERP